MTEEASLEVDFYYLLGIEEDASPKDIKLAYRRMAEVYHPDKLRELPEESRKEGEEIMRLLNEAKSILLDPQRREMYDNRIGVGLEVQDVIVLEEPAPMEQTFPGYMVAIEKETMTKKMSRVLDSMKVVFSRDKEFQTKIAIAEEIVEALVIEEPKRKRMKDVMVLDEEEDEEVEMKVHFTVVDEKVGGDPDISKTQKEKRFRILAIEGDDEDKISEEDEVDMEWE